MNFARSWALVVGLGVGAFLANCGPAKPPCSSTTCTGCCDSKTGACVSLTTSQACGRSGEACKACSLAESCSFGTCMVTSSGSGGGFSSGGGFVSSGGSAGGGSAGGGFATGGGFSSGGGFATGGGSAGGPTGGGSGSCNSGNCSSGCCQNGSCRNFPNNAMSSSCGFGGQTCVVCQSGQTCNQTTLTCQGGPPVGGGSATGGGSAGGSSSVSYSQTSITASCEDLSVGATPLIDASTSPPIGDDETTAPFIVPGFGTFFSTTIAYASVQTNGMVQVYPTSSGAPSNAYSNTTIPTVGAPNGFAAVLWDDLYAYSPLTANASVRVKTISSPAHYTISWLDPLAAGTEFQAKFFATGVIEFHYCNLGVASLTETVGLEDLTGSTGVTWSGTPTTGSGVRFTRVP